MRRATDPWESHQGGITNTLVPEPEIPSLQGPDAQSVDPELDVVTMAVKVPETLAHLRHSRNALIRMEAGLTALNTVKGARDRSDRRGSRAADSRHHWRAPAR